MPIDPKILDFANHHPDALLSDIESLCQSVTQHGFNAAFVNPHWVPIMREEIGFTSKVGTIVAFHLGQDSLDIKLQAAQEYAAQGANELDIHLNVSLIKQSFWDQSLHEMKSLVDTIKSSHPEVIVKLVPETGYLTDDEIRKTAKLIQESGADFYKTNSGMGPRGASLDDVKLIKETVGDDLKIKVAGGIREPQEAQRFIEAGVSRIGTSAAPHIIGTDSPPPQTHSHMNE